MCRSHASCGASARCASSSTGCCAGYHGASDAPEGGEALQPRLHAVTLHAHAAALARPLAALGLEELGAQVRAVRRPGAAKKLAPDEAGPLHEGDVIVLLGTPQALAAAELRLLQGQ